MPKKKLNLIVIGRFKEFDNDAWKRLLMAYAYYLHEQRGSSEPVPDQPRADEQEDGGAS